MIHCPLCRQVSEAPKLTYMEGKAVPRNTAFIFCPNCGYDTTIKTDPIDIIVFEDGASSFDPLELPLDMPIEDLLLKRIEFERLELVGNHSYRQQKEFVISVLENAPREITKLDQKITKLVTALQSPDLKDKFVLDGDLDSFPRRKTEIERMALCWIRAIIQRHESKGHDR